MTEIRCHRTGAAPEHEPSYSGRHHCRGGRWETSPAMYHDGALRSIDRARCNAVARFHSQQVGPSLRLCGKPPLRFAPVTGWRVKLAGCDREAWARVIARGSDCIAWSRGRATLFPTRDAARAEAARWASDYAARVVRVRIKPAGFRRFVAMCDRFLTNYPATVFPGESGDPGVAFVVRIRAAVEALKESLPQ